MNFNYHGFWKLSFVCGVTFLSLNPDRNLVFDNDITHKPTVHNSGRPGETNQKTSKAVILICSNGCSGLTCEMAHFYKRLEYFLKESQNHRLVEVGRHFWRSSGLILVHMQGHDCVQMPFAFASFSKEGDFTTSQCNLHQC